MQPLKRGYFSHLPPERWEEGMLCGSGTIGAVVMGQPLQERIILSHEKLFIPWKKKLPPVESWRYLGEIRAMLARGQFRQAAQFVENLGQQAGYGEKRWTDPFFPACDLAVAMEPAGEIQAYAHSLDYTSGLSTTEWQDDRSRIQRRVFVSRADGIMAVRIDIPAGGNVSCRIEDHQHPPEPEDDYWARSIKYREGLGRAEARAWVEGAEGWLTYHGGFSRAASSYLCAARVIAADGGTLAEQDGMLHIYGARTVMLLLDLRLVGEKEAPPLEDMKNRLAGLITDFDQLLARHAAIHGPLFERVMLQMGADDDWLLPAEEAWEKAQHGNPSPAYFRRIFDAGRYEILSSSGEWAPNLQGLWSGIYNVPWSSDYTQNGNVQTAIAGLLDGNLPECMDSYLRYLEFLIEDSRENARNLYGCRGILLASRTSSHGLNNHFDTIFPMTFWTAGAGWGARFFYDTWLRTGDNSFFLHRALPYMKEVAAFYEDFLIEDENGRWLFSPSYSPENHPGNTDSQAAVNATMDIAVARELFNNLIEGCRTLGIEGENIQRWERMLAKMPPYMINTDGAAKEWCDPRLEDRYDHRHASHLYPLMYGTARELREDAALMTAFQKAYEHRVLGRMKEANIMAFGSVQLGQAAAHLGDMATLWRLLRDLASGYYYRNFSTSHDRGPAIFNADLSGGMSALIFSALMQSEVIALSNGAIDTFRITLLPALPAAWPDGAVRGLLARGGFVVDLEWSEGSLAWVNIRSPIGKKCRVCYKDVEVQPEDFHEVMLRGADFVAK